MSCRILPQKSAWSCETNMSSAIDQATRLTTRAGASSRSSCAHPRDFRRSASIPRPDFTPPATELFRRLFPSLRYFSLLICAAVVFSSAALAQIPIPNSVPPPPGQDANAGKQGSKLVIDVDLVVLHTTVLDDRHRFADGLKSENFRVFEDKIDRKSTRLNSSHDQISYAVFCLKKKKEAVWGKSRCGGRQCRKPLA